VDEKKIINEFEVSFHLIFCAVLPIDKIRKVWYNLAGRSRTRRPEIPLYHKAGNLSSKIFEKIAQKLFPETVQSAGVRPWRTFTLGGHFTAVKR
jgi:hypothetical protein